MDTLRTSEIFNDSTLTLIAIESIHSRHYKTNGGCHVYGNIVPIAVIVYSSDRVYALDMEGKPANFDELKRDIPELDASIDRQARHS